MLAKTKKKILLIAIPILMLIVIPTLFYWIKYGPKQLVNKLPDEDIVRVVRVVEKPTITGEKIPDIELPKEKISMFWDLIKDLKYKRFFNPCRYKYFIPDDMKYMLYYDNYTVHLREHYFSVVDKNGKTVYSVFIGEMQPNGVFDEIEKLFLEE